MKANLILLFVIFTSYSLHAAEAVEPIKAKEVARDFLANQFKVHPLVIDQHYYVDWEYMIVDEEDQPVEFRFTGVEQACRVQVASESLRVISFACRSIRGVEFNQSPGCGTYDGNFITLSEPQDEASCRRIAAEKGILERTVMSYCSVGLRPDIDQMSFVEACTMAFKDIGQRNR